jgi:hypothetical protein
MNSKMNYPAGCGVGVEHLRLGAPAATDQLLHPAL